MTANNSGKPPSQEPGTRVKATDYLTKAPEGGYPAWVMEMGADQRVRRMTTSRGFGLAPAPRQDINPPFPKGRKRSPYTKKNQTYQERTDKCGSTVHLFGVRQDSDGFTNEVKMERQWLATLDVDSDVIGQLSMNSSESCKTSRLSQHNASVRAVSWPLTVTSRR